MTKAIIIVLLTSLILGCTDINQQENTNAKLEDLRAENDSLKKIVADINNKYVFDSISIRDIPSYMNTYELNSKVSGEIVFAGYNINKNTNVILVDSLSFNPKKLYNPDTLRLNNGGFLYETELSADRISLKGIIEMKNDYGKEYEGIYNTAIGAKKN
ncbi:hypothetical protein [Marinirhabdus gelatinilytica]|uniref:Uncharacterized protein n=1 Tax=Marinirhabdus gelatinilytica TaxID=1703343 RepID=A0A370QFZ6_9FLAO|nr:hypothetical protein [Marinirhabdus gelatinilytica]RDK87283.1 hypothetical protein C8D94_102470 [Marinirhabdus gelatinilytica]